MQQKASPAMIAVAVVLSVLVAGAIGYFATRPSQDAVSKENAPSYAKGMMNNSQGGTAPNYGETYRQGAPGYRGRSGQNSSGPTR